LAGLLGPWISGGVEFNWPQHHRPSTFMPVDHLIEKHADGSCTVRLGEHEPMNRMKGMVGICLYPGKAFVEAKVQLYNRTPFVQTFLWWANAAVSDKRLKPSRHFERFCRSIRIILKRDRNCEASRSPSARRMPSLRRADRMGEDQ
jgi:hypothetical protein